MERAAELPFKLKVIGPSRAVLPDQSLDLGLWVVERPQSPELLPKRARERLMQILEAGIRPVDLVVYHEKAKPSLIQSHLSPALKSSTSRLATWSSQDLPVLIDLVRQLVRAHGPTVIKVVAAAGLLVLTVAMYCLLTAAVVVAHDPVLCIVVSDEDSDGERVDYWIEIDRWFS
jgi:hypothetical protein